MGVAGFVQLSACPRSATVQQQQQLLLILFCVVISFYIILIILIFLFLFIFTFAIILVTYISIYRLAFLSLPTIPTLFLFMFRSAILFFCCVYFPLC